MSRETITGTLRVTRQRKYRRSNNILSDYIVTVAEDALDKARYYPPILVMETERRRACDGGAFIWKFKGVPAALKDAETGDRVTVTATIQEFTNGIGAYLIRPRVLSVERETKEAASAP